jgi:hypothetical protein
MHFSKKSAGLLILASLVFLLTACFPLRTPTPVATPAVIIVTQVVTQVITPTPLPTTAVPPTATKVVPTATPTYDPLSAPIYYPLKDCVASRLHIGDKAKVSLGGGPNGIRYGLDLHQDAIAGYAQPGAILEITNGPYCSNGWIVWMVRTVDGLAGFTPEGNGNEYWLFPVGP